MATTAAEIEAAMRGEAKRMTVEEQLAASVKWNTFGSVDSVIQPELDPQPGVDHAIVQLDVAPLGFSGRRQLNVAACGIRFAVAGGPVPMRAEQIRRRLEAGTICRDCLRNTIGELADGAAS